MRWHGNKRETLNLPTTLIGDRRGSIQAPQQKKHPDWVLDRSQR